MIHSERDLFSSVAFFAKKKRAEQKDLCEVTSFFFFFYSPPGEPDLVLFCGWRDRSGTQCLQRAGQAVCTKLPPKKSQLQWAFQPLHFLFFLSTVKLKKSLLMMVAWKQNNKKKTADYCKVAWAARLPAGGGRRRAGGRPGSGRSSAVTPLRPRGAVPGWKQRDGWGE